jgi:hypothetical protein
LLLYGVQIGFRFLNLLFSLNLYFGVGFDMVKEKLPCISVLVSIWLKKNFHIRIKKKQIADESGLYKTTLYEV